MAGFLSKFQNKLVALLALGTLIPVALVGGYSVVAFSIARTDLASKQMQLQGSDSAEVFGVFLDNVEADLLYLSQTPPIQGIVRARENKGIDPLDNSSYEDWEKRLNIIFSSFLEARPFYAQIRYLDENGNELLKLNNNNNKIEIVNKAELQNETSSDYFTEAMKLREGEIYVSPINLSRENGQIEQPYKPVIRYATPIYNEAGEKRGIVIANLLIENLFEIADKEEFEQEYQQKLIVVNDQGYYLYHSDDSKTWGFELNHNETVKNDYPEAVASQILSGESGFIQEGIDSLISYNTIYPDDQRKENAFVLLYETPKNVIYAPINKVKGVATFITIGSVIICLGIGILILKKLVNSITNVTEYISSYSSQVLATVEEQERMATEQSSSIHETTVTMDELSASSQQSAQQAEAAATGARITLNSVEKGNEAVEKTLREMSILKEKVEAIAAQIQNLSKETNQIANVSDLVSDIANQTNMLALNAAVEAVRAGENGKGFGVVASEIRKLADESRKSAEKINGLVRNIQTAIKSTVTVTQDGTKNLETGVKIAQETAQVFADVANAMEEIATNSQQIALTSKQQAIATQQATETMGHITAGVRETAQGISQTKTGTQQLNQAASNLKELV